MFLTQEGTHAESECMTMLRIPFQQSINQAFGVEDANDEPSQSLNTFIFYGSNFITVCLA